MYFDDVFIHGRAEDGQTAMEVHLKHLRQVFEIMRANKLYANIDKCVFVAEEIQILDCFVSRVGVRADPGKVRFIAPQGPRRTSGSGWVYPTTFTNTAQGTLNLHDPCRIKEGYRLGLGHHNGFNSIKASLQHAPVLALPDETKSFSVVCEVSDYAIA
ncbi:LOW QUALITY PROTEIN: reverse transcriptase [Phytophthora palmivora]|uniref:Reverse transcriptase n=1 Tax=Phytophthora palmivora TaxID=4796 RepID=A0A2P4X3X5_9STRA|nr:LOW QUALITY PROTEIN: reverse transcriptase [Phytophthora palmivora]